MTTPPFYDQLLAATRDERARLQSLPLLADAAQGKGTLAQYTAFLGQAYHHVKHTVPLLMACGARLPARLEWLRDAVAEYIAEERGHQEWILDDLRACGVDAEQVRQAVPAPATELLVAYAYYVVEHLNPVAFFAMVLVLEGTSVALATQVAGALQRTLALPDEAFRYLTSHGDLDHDHVAFFAELMNRLDDRDDRAAILHAAPHFYRLYGDVFRQLEANPGV